MAKSNIVNYDSLIHATAGATASIIAMFLIYPLDNIKLRMQLQDDALANKSTLQAFIYILKEEGLESLYRGISPVLTSLGISNFVYFYTFHGFKSLQLKDLESTAKSDLLISTIAGIVNVFVTNPLWVVNSRLKIGNETHYTGLLDGLVHITLTEGLGALWSSIWPSLLLVSNPAIQFTVYEVLKRCLPNVTNSISFFIMGAIAKTIATVLTYPLQLAQSKQRYNRDSGINLFTLLFYVLRTNGPSALYQGLGAKLLQTVIMAALMFMTYEKIVWFIYKIFFKN